MWGYLEPGLRCQPAVPLVPGCHAEGLVVLLFCQSKGVALTHFCAWQRGAPHTGASSAPPWFLPGCDGPTAAIRAALPRIPAVPAPSQGAELLSWEAPRALSPGTCRLGEVFWDRRRAVECPGQGPWLPCWPLPRLGKEGSPGSGHSLIACVSWAPPDGPSFPNSGWGMGHVGGLGALQCLLWGWPSESPEKLCGPPTQE